MSTMVLYMTEVEEVMFTETPEYTLEVEAFNMFYYKNTRIYRVEYTLFSGLDIGSL